MRNTNCKVRQYTLSGEFIKEFENVKEAAKELSVSKSTIAQAVIGRRKTGAGHIFKYHKEEKPILSFEDTIKSLPKEYEYFNKEFDCMQIPLSKTNFRGEYALVDKDDFCDSVRYNWAITIGGKGTSYYAYRTIRVDGKKKNILIHRVILNPSKDMFIDHRNHNGLDNRRCNIRICTASQNSCNISKKKSITSSKYIGVHYCNTIKKWIARSRRSFIGSFIFEKEAALRYNEYIKAYNGEFANLNVIED